MALTRGIFFTAGVLTGDLLAVYREVQRELTQISQQRKSVVAWDENAKVYLIDITSDRRVKRVQEQQQVRVDYAVGPTFRWRTGALYVRETSPRAFEEMRRWRAELDRTQADLRQSAYKRSLVPQIIAWLTPSKQ